MLLHPEPLRAFVAELFTAAGAPPTAATRVAEHLVEANLKGHDSHGVGMVPAYVRNIRAGHLKSDAHATLVRRKGAVLLMDGGHGFGQVVGREAVAAAIDHAREFGVCALGLRNAHHLGRIGDYGEQCGRAGMVSVHFVNVVGHEPQVAPWGGRDRRMTTNPFCCVVPRPGQEPVVLDMATSAIALGKVRVAWMKGVPVPDGALVDADGTPTTDAAVMFKEPFGALGPFGMHKGYGLALMCELLGGGLAAQWTAQPGQPRVGTIVNNMLAFVVDPEAFGDLPGFHAEVQAMVDYIHSTRPAPGFDAVQVPGEPERATQAARGANGIEIDERSWQGIVEAAVLAGVPAQSIATRAWWS